MAKKEKDYSVKLVNKAHEEEFKVYTGCLEEGIALMAGSADRFFDKFASKKVIIVNNKLEMQDRRTAMAMAFKSIEENYTGGVNEFYFEIKVEELDATKVFDELVDRKKFEKRYNKLSRKNSYNDTVVTLSKEFNMKPSLVAKYAKEIR